MAVYLSLLAGAVILGIPMCRSKAGKIMYSVLMGAALYIVAAIRRNVGYDYTSIYGVIYYRTITTPVDVLMNAREEKGYLMINKLLSDYFVDYQAIFIVCAVFYMIAVVYLIYRHCKIPWIGFALFMTFGVYFNSLNFQRQMIAGFIVMYAFKYIEKNQFFRYVLIVVFASCFHLSALIMIPFYFILRIKMTPVTLGVYVGLTVIMLIFSWNIIDFITGLGVTYRGYISTSIHMTTGVNPTYVIFFAIFFAAAFFVRKRLMAADRFNNVLLNCMFFTLFFEVIGVKHSILSRPGVYFVIPAAIALMPKVIITYLEICKEKYKSDRNKRRSLSAVTVTAFVVLNLTMFGLMLANNYNGVMPYRTMFDNFEAEAAEQ